MLAQNPTTQGYSHRAIAAGNVRAAGEFRRYAAAIGADNPNRRDMFLGFAHKRINYARRARMTFVPLP